MSLEHLTNPSGPRRAAVEAFLNNAGLAWEQGIEFTVNLLEEGQIVATGSLDGDVLKCIAVDETRQGEGYAATIVTALWKEAHARGRSHLFLYTTPENAAMFSGLGFYTVARAENSLLMENRRNGIGQFLAGLPRPAVAGRVGAVVANCNPFTLGHRYLVEHAAARCDAVHLFILSEERSLFPAAARLELARLGTADLPNVLVHPTGGYLVSAATFPTYFLKDANPENVRCELDLAVFAAHFAPHFNISVRFVGTEPISPVTDAYNRAMAQALPPRGIAVELVERKWINGGPVSASRVRRLLAQGRLEDIRPLVPPTTYAYLASPPEKCPEQLP